MPCHHETSPDFRNAAPFLFVLVYSPLHYASVHNFPTFIHKINLLPLSLYVCSLFSANDCVHLLWVCHVFWTFALYRYTTQKLRFHLPNVSRAVLSIQGQAGAAHWHGSAAWTASAANTVLPTKGDHLGSSWCLTEFN